jgi:hypothetical protein
MRQATHTHTALSVQICQTYRNNQQHNTVLCSPWDSYCLLRVQCTIAPENSAVNALSVRRGEFRVVHHPTLVPWCIWRFVWGLR